MLHIVNGDSVGEKLKSGGINGDILVWREMYTAGPVFRYMDEPLHRQARSAFMEQELGVPAETYIAISEAQDRALQASARHEAIILWFEYDLYDQTMLSCLLHAFSRMELGETKLFLLTMDSFPGIPDFRGLGQLSEEQLLSLEGAWQAIGQEELAAGREIWERYSSPDLVDHLPLASADWPKLPYMRAAMQSHLSRLPSLRGGLGIIEQETLQAVAGGIRTPIALFERVGGRLHRLGMGDLEYWHRLKRMTELPSPILRMETPIDYPTFRQPSPQFPAAAFALTELGQLLLAGSGSLAELQPPDTWLGGFRLSEGTPWRWDADRNEAVLTRE